MKKPKVSLEEINKLCDKVHSYDFDNSSREQTEMFVVTLVGLVKEAANIIEDYSKALKWSGDVIYNLCDKLENSCPELKEADIINKLRITVKSVCFDKDE